MYNKIGFERNLKRHNFVISSFLCVIPSLIYLIVCSLISLACVSSHSKGDDEEVVGYKNLRYNTMGLSLCNLPIYIALTGTNIPTTEVYN